MSFRFPPSSILSQPTLLAAGFAILVMISGTGVWLVAQTRADARQVMRTLDVKEKLSNLQGLVWRTEGDQRAFLLTGAQSYRDAFRADVEAVKSALTRSKAALAGATGPPGRAELSADLNAAVAAELAGLQDAVARRDRDGAGTSSPMPSDALAQSRSEEIRALIAKFVRQEQQLLTGEIRASQRAGQLLLLANFGGTFLIIALAATSVTMVRCSTAGLRSPTGPSKKRTRRSRRRLRDAPPNCERRTRKSSTLPIS